VFTKEGLQWIDTDETEHPSQSENISALKEILDTVTNFVADEDDKNNIALLVGVIAEVLTLDNPEDNLKTILMVRAGKAVTVGNETIIFNSFTTVSINDAHEIYFIGTYGNFEKHALFKVTIDPKQLTLNPNKKLEFTRVLGPARFTPI
jgi:hypothetical protein